MPREHRIDAAQASRRASHQQIEVGGGEGRGEGEERGEEEPPAEHDLRVSLVCGSVCVGADSRSACSCRAEPKGCASEKEEKGPQFLRCCELREMCHLDVEAEGTLPPKDLVRIPPMTWVDMYLRIFRDLMQRHCMASCAPNTSSPTLRSAKGKMIASPIKEGAEDDTLLSVRPSEFIVDTHSRSRRCIGNRSRCDADAYAKAICHHQAQKKHKHYTVPPGNIA